MYNILCCNSNREVEWSVTMKIKKDWKSVDFQSFGVPKKGLEPSRLAAHAPETCASTNSATWAFGLFASAKLVKFFELPTIFAQKVQFFFFARCGWAVLGQRFMPVSLL